VKRTAIVVASALVLLPLLAALAGGLRWTLPDLALLTVLYVGAIAPGEAVPDLLLAFGVGYLTDLHTAAPPGIHVLCYLALLLVARQASRRLLLRRAFDIMVASGVTVTLHWLVAAALICRFDGVSAVRTANLPQLILVSALCAPPWFWLLSRLDARVDQPTTSYLPVPSR
jgi:cell shape-determining protein MreD